MAILIHHFQYWIRHNKALGINCIEGKTWTYQTYNQIIAHFPYWSKDQVKRLIKKMVDEKILIKGKFNKNPYDQTIWYAFENEEKFSIFSISKRTDLDPDPTIEMAKSPHRENEIAPSTYGEIATCNIEDNKTEDTKRNILKSECTRAKKIIKRVHVDRPEDIPFGDYVRLTQAELNKLFEQIPKQVVHEYIDSINYHCAERQLQGYKDYYLTVLQWIKNDIKKGILKNVRFNLTPKENIREESKKVKKETIPSMQYFYEKGEVSEEYYKNWLKRQKENKE